MKQLTALLFFLLSISIPLLSQIQRSPEITANELREHVKYLSSEKLEGRLTGSKGADLAAEYIANEFRMYGLKQNGDSGSFYQKFEFVSGVKLGLENQLFIVETEVLPNNPKEQTKSNLKIKNRLAAVLNQDYRPLGYSLSGSYSGEIVFAGYGISSADKSYDDYKDLSVKDKIVMVLRYAPSSDSIHGNFEQYSSLRYKTAKAKELGARAIIVVTGPADSDKDELIRLAYDQATGNSGILSLNITRALADTILKNSKTTIKQLQDQILQERQPKSFAIQGVTVNLTVDINEIRAQAKNVIGFLDGNDTTLKNEVLVIGAHYDHLGYGGEGSGSLRPDTIAIHPGADDNASGTSGLLELAQLFSNQRDRLKRSILFIAFTGEELGLLGSGHYVKHPTIPLESTVTMLNLDMIGHLNNRLLIVDGVGTSPGFDSLARVHNLDSAFILKLNKDGFGPSDYSSFFSKQIPVLNLFTNINEYYHRPIDTYDRLNYEGLQKIVAYAASLALDLDRIPNRPKFVATEMPKMAGNTGRSMRVFVGTIPDFSEQSEGMKISGVRQGSPAAKAGLQGGDIIIKFGKVDIKNLYDYTYALGEYKVGDIVDVVVKRGKEIINTKVTLERRN